MKLGIIVSRFNIGMTTRMLETAEKAAKTLKIKTTVKWVPGAYDMPLQIKRMLESDVDAVALIGVVKKGETAHDQIVAENTARLAADLSLQYNKPVTLGIIGHGATLAAARERLDEYAERAVKAAYELVGE